MSKIYQGHLLIADITGYTMYLTQSELDHAQEILAALLEIIVKAIHPPLVISRLAGDAVISYGLNDHAVQGQTFIEMIESIYIAFQRAIEQMVLNNNCQCNACRNIASLDLKFFVHAGSFAKQNIGAYEELVGSDVNMIHRLLKNHVTERTGLSAYTLYTAAALQTIGEEDLKGAMVPLVESYEHLGEVGVWVQDMKPVWERKRKAAPIHIPPEQLLEKAQAVIHLPLEITWDYLVRPSYRKILMGSDRQEILGREHGRIDAGSAYHCYHGDRLVNQTVLEWQPFEHMLTEDTMPVPKVTILVEYSLEAVQEGTCLTISFSKSRGPWPARALCDQAMRGMAKQTEQNIAAFRKVVEGGG